MKISKWKSRKLWMAVAGMVAGLAVALGVSQSTVAAVAGAVTAACSAVSYILSEGRVDAAAVRFAAEQAERAASAVKAEAEKDGADA